MNKEWLTAKELVGRKGLPTSTQGINAMARREKWLSRKRRGIQGKALEYHISSIPIDLEEFTMMYETSGGYQVKRDEHVHIWQEAYNQLSHDERMTILSFIMRKGALALVHLINQNSHT